MKFIVTYNFGKGPVDVVFEEARQLALEVKHMKEMYGVEPYRIGVKFEND